ncbi:hypothetical protein CHARACLAT_009066 [Characodon lateralis]|uniref:Uncharacterized protein n=1 Tax=Characodon lateralis TaxID=208331 RepID=A0ABU7D5X9_9TELE|nr:hypothetical protein [Characodon lateralis]
MGGRGKEPCCYYMYIFFKSQGAPHLDEQNAHRPPPTAANTERAYRSQGETSGSERPLKAPSSPSPHRGSGSGIDPPVAACSVNHRAAFGGAERRGCPGS